MRSDWDDPGEIDGRIRNLLCRQWRCAPWELSARIERGEVSWRMARGAMVMAAVEVGIPGWLEMYLTPKAAEAARVWESNRKRHANLARLLTLVSPKTEEERAEVERVRERLKREGF